MSLSSIQALPLELKVIVAGYLDLPSLAALRRTSYTFSFIQSILYQRDGQYYPLLALPYAIRSGNIQWMELALYAMKPNLQPALSYIPLAVTQGSEQMLQQFLETVLEFTPENEGGTIVMEACFSTLRDYQRDPQLQILLSYLPNPSWLHIFSRKAQLHDGALRTALEELVSQRFHPVAQKYLQRANELVDSYWKPSLPHHQPPKSCQFMMNGNRQFISLPSTDIPRTSKRFLAGARWLSLQSTIVRHGTSFFTGPVRTIRRHLYGSSIP